VWLRADYSGAQRRVGGIGDEEDVEAASRAGLGSRAALGGARAAAAALSAHHMKSEPFAGVPADEADAEAEAALREEMAKEEKGKGNRAFAENRVRRVALALRA
jgi:hypothetical protein